MLICTSPWIPTLASFKPTPNPNLIGLPQFHVEELIDHNNRSWNSSFVEDLFYLVYVHQIKNIHIFPRVMLYVTSIYFINVIGFDPIII
jgi:hypothetical protein